MTVKMAGVPGTDATLPVAGKNGGGAGDGGQLARRERYKSASGVRRKLSTKKNPGPDKPGGLARHW